jgi:hypothetical protein
MFSRRFAAGDRVVIVSGESNMHKRPGIYTVVRVMPLSGTGFQYRVKTALDTHERVVDECELAPANG